MATDKLGQLHREGKKDTPEFSEAYKEYQAAMKEAREEKENRQSEENPIKKWEDRGAEDFKAGKRRVPPYEEMSKPGVMIGSPESKENIKKMDAWLRGWDRANIAAPITKAIASIKKSLEAYK